MYTYWSVINIPLSVSYRSHHHTVSGPGSGARRNKNQFIFQTKQKSTTPNRTHPYQTQLNYTKPNSSIPNRTNPQINTKPNSSILNWTQLHQTKLIHTKPNSSTPNQTHPYQTELNCTKPNSSIPNQTHPYQTKPSQTIPNQIWPTQTGWVCIAEPYPAFPYYLLLCLLLSFYKIVTHLLTPSVTFVFQGLAERSSASQKLEFCLNDCIIVFAFRAVSAVLKLHRCVRSNNSSSVQCSHLCRPPQLGLVSAVPLLLPRHGPRAVRRDGGRLPGTASPCHASSRPDSCMASFCYSLAPVQVSCVLLWASTAQYPPVWLVKPFSIDSARL